MERLRQQLAAAAKAYGSLRAVESLDLAPVEKRDIAIMRFIYTLEATWKAARFFLAEIEGSDASMPKSCVRASFEAGLLTAEQAKAALTMIDDRNLTVHIYNEKLAEEIFSRLKGHVEVLGVWLAAIKGRIEKTG